MNNFEPLVLAILGAAYTTNAETLERMCDNVADHVVSAVKSSDTQLDDAAADALAKQLRRIADRIDAGLQTVADQA